MADHERAERLARERRFLIGGVLLSILGCVVMLFLVILGVEVTKEAKVGERGILVSSSNADDVVKTDRRIEQTELNSALPFHILASLDTVHIEADSGRSYIFKIAGAERENGGLLLLATATGDSLIVKGRAVELRTKDGRIKILRAPRTTRVALASPDSLGGQVWIAPNGQVGNSTVAGRHRRSLLEVPVEGLENNGMIGRTLLQSSAGSGSNTDTVTYAPTLSDSSLTGGGCSGSDPIQSVCLYTANKATVNRVITLEPELSAAPGISVVENPLASGQAVLLAPGDKVEMSFSGDVSLPYIVVDSIRYIPRGPSSGSVRVSVDGVLLGIANAPANGFAEDPTQFRSIGAFGATMEAAGGMHVLTLEVAGNAGGVQLEIDTVNLFRFMTLNFDGVTCTDCAGCATAKLNETGVCPCDGWVPDSKGMCLPECNRWHLGPAGVARFDYNADGSCIFYNEDGTPRPKPADSDLCQGPGGVSIRGGSMCVNTTVAALLTCPVGRVRTEAPVGCIYFDNSAKAQDWHTTLHTACKASATPSQCTCDIMSSSNITISKDHGAIRSCSDIGICSSDVDFAPATACSSACSIAADGLTLKAPSDKFVHMAPPYSAGTYGEFTISPIVINTVSVFSALQGSLTTCISHVEYGCVKNDITKGAFPDAQAQLPFCRSMCETACKQWPRPSWFAEACETGPTPSCTAGEASASTSFYFSDGSIVPPLDVPVKRYAWEVKAANDAGYNTRLYSKLTEAETKQAASYYDAMCIKHEINDVAKICVGANGTGCFVPDVPVSHWHTVRDACLLAITLTARAATFQAPASPQDVTNATFLQAYNIMNNARAKYDHRVQQRIYLIYDWRFGPSIIEGGVTKTVPCIQSWIYLDGPSYGAPGQYNDRFKYCMCDTNACAPPLLISPPPSPPPLPPPPSPPPSPQPPPPNICIQLGTCEPPKPPPLYPPRPPPRPPPPPLMSPPPVNSLSASLRLLSLDKESALAYTQDDGNALAKDLGKALAKEVGVTWEPNADVSLTYPVADVIEFVGMREDVFGSSDAEAIRTAVADANTVPMSRVEILRVTSSKDTAQAAVDDQPLASGSGRRRKLHQLVSGVGFADTSLSPPPPVAGPPVVYVAVRAEFNSAAGASCGVQRRLILDVADLAKCTLSASATVFTNSLVSWQSSSGSAHATHLSSASFMADSSLAMTHNAAASGALFHPAEVKPQLSVTVTISMTLSSEQDANKMGDALAALQSPSSTSSAKLLLTSAGMAVSGLQYSSYSGTPSEYFVIKATPPGANNPPPPFTDEALLGKAPDGNSKVSSQNTAIAIGSVFGILFISLCAAAYYYSQKSRSHVYHKAKIAETVKSAFERSRSIGSSASQLSLREGNDLDDNDNGAVSKNLGNKVAPS